MSKGEHIYIHAKYFITHHGIDCGDGTVIHYRGKEKGGRIVKTSYNEFAQGEQVYVRTYPYKFSSNEIVERANRRLRESNYDLIINNCEHFATDCTIGEPDSQQVGNATFSVGAGVAAGAGLLAVETAVPAAGLLGAVGFTTTVGLPVAVVVGGAALAGSAVFGVVKLFSEGNDKKY